MHESNPYTEQTRHRWKEKKSGYETVIKYEIHNGNMEQGGLNIIHSPLRAALAERCQPSRRFGPGRHARHDKDMNSALGNDACMIASWAAVLNGAFEGSECLREVPSRPESALGLVVASRTVVCWNGAA